MPGKIRAVIKTSGTLDPRSWWERHGSITQSSLQCKISLKAGMQSSFWRKIENRPMTLTSWSWVKIPASSAKFTWLAWHRKSEILVASADIWLPVLWMGRFILGTKNTGVLVHFNFETVTHSFSTLILLMNIVSIKFDKRPTDSQQSIHRFFPKHRLPVLVGRQTTDRRLTVGEVSVRCRYLVGDMSVQCWL